MQDISIQENITKKIIQEIIENIFTKETILLEQTVHKKIDLYNSLLINKQLNNELIDAVEQNYILQVKKCIELGANLNAIKDNLTILG